MSAQGRETTANSPDGTLDRTLSVPVYDQLPICVVGFDECQCTEVHLPRKTIHAGYFVDSFENASLTRRSRRDYQP